MTKTVKGATTDPRNPAELALERIERMLNTVVVALEILTGICAGLEEVDEEEDARQIQGEEADEGECPVSRFSMVI